jgi:exo-beta-1,3-glucanase (GH17 family)
MSYREGVDFKLEELEYKSYEGVDLSEHTADDLNSIWRKTLKSGMHGICFSMYEDGQEPGDTITAAQVERRVKILKPFTKWIRSFSCIQGNEHIPRVSKKHGLKTMAGAWLGDDDKKNKQEIKALIELANEGNVDIAAVGNEVLYRNDLSLDELIDYMKEVRAAIPAHIPMGYVDAYYEFSSHPELVEHSDVILSNCYPLLGRLSNRLFFRTYASYVWSSCRCSTRQANYYYRNRLAKSGWWSKRCNCERKSCNEVFY